LQIKFLIGVVSIRSGPACVVDSRLTTGSRTKPSVS